MNPVTLHNILQTKGISLTEFHLATLDAFVQFVLEKNLITNLTAHRTPEQLYEKGILDSLIFPLHGQQPINYLDIGSGAGFPGIPLHIVYPFLKTTLLEPLGKKATFLTSCIHHLALKNISVIQDRAEILAQNTYRESFDLVTARAVIHLQNLVELALPLVKVGGFFYAFKGSDFQEEVDASLRAIKVLGGELIEIKHSELPSEHDHRVLLIIKKIKTTDRNYPRMFSQIKHSPL
jgi:16S rRNA (guanine527-N7)-methyltransferase